jgi:hypothetical protein
VILSIKLWWAAAIAAATRRRTQDDNTEIHGDDPAVARDWVQHYADQEL